MILIALSTLLSAIVINLFKEKGQKVPVPRWILKVGYVSFQSSKSNCRILLLYAFVPNELSKAKKDICHFNYLNIF